ncbi:PREDICTED: uncharacterized protein LOC108562162 isoform X2 [Nicrophorus vespilloides]|nr:PREDICTED: uncharacterized protein LOC108562162 isoform X2 [Nicrophorus vespilloides]XP_017775879.1 PREDICTED: uncharacterized protein LOC108562162 isoform X2 [Nicrophorus vespilloides]
MDTVYPEPLSRLHRRVVPKKRKGTSNRYRTQPVTFLEIQEVDEDNLDDSAVPEPTTSRSELNILNSKFDEFRRSRDLILSNKSENEVDVVESKSAVPLSNSRSTGRLPPRPSI